MLGLLGLRSLLGHWMTCSWNLGIVDAGNRAEDIIRRILGFSEYLAQYQKYLFQFKLGSLALQHYLVPGTTHTAQVVEFNIYKTKFEVSLCSCGGLFLTLPSRNI